MAKKQNVRGEFNQGGQASIRKAVHVEEENDRQKHFSIWEKIKIVENAIVCVEEYLVLTTVIADEVCT